MPQDGESPAGRTSGPGRDGGVPSNVPASLLDTAPYRIGSVTLVAQDLDGLARFYRTALGLVTVSQNADVVRLGVDETVLLELRHDPGARPWSPGEAGLFHTAFLLPSRGDLGAWLAHAAERGLHLSGAADHLVSEAVYLTDPEGNGIEVYVDRPSVEWPREEDGTFAMRNDRLDHAGLLRAAPGRWTGMPAGGRVGHVHLQVGALEPAERFYAGLLGFDVRGRYPGATFLGSGGYHHQLATNVWNSLGAQVRPAGMAGLGEVTLLIETEALATVRARSRDGDLSVEEAREALIVRDPWGTLLRLTPAGAVVLR
ncbi:VOC family protein [Methylobacterium durans]|uniref:VOC family protein n=1 Tax=Methylobacterium durans TaxID=2202825 RepID=UPI002AFFA1D2|nr:VOC family protein [Methylobacterium durans]MEA1834922.1 VOC family protein [Methylobacterium durans]